MAITPGVQEQDFDPTVQEAEKQIVDRKSALKAANSLLRTQIANHTSTIDKHSHAKPGDARLPDNVILEYKTELADLRTVWDKLIAGNRPEVAKWFQTKALALGKSSELARQEAERYSKDPEFNALRNILALIQGKAKAPSLEKSLLPGLDEAAEIVRRTMSLTLCGEAQARCNQDAKQAVIYSAVATNITKQ